MCIYILRAKTPLSCFLLVLTICLNSSISATGWFDQKKMIAFEWSDTLFSDILICCSRDVMAPLESISGKENEPESIIGIWERLFERMKCDVQGEFFCRGGTASPDNRDRAGASPAPTVKCRGTLTNSFARVRQFAAMIIASVHRFSGQSGMKWTP